MRWGFVYLGWQERVVVIKVAMNESKSRSKVLKIAVWAPGVQSAGFTGKELDQLEVVGEGIDAAVLTSLLRKNVGPSDLIRVGFAEKKEEKKIEILPAAWNSYPYQLSPPYYPIQHYPVEYTNHIEIEILRSDWNSYPYQFSAPSYPIQHYPVEYTNHIEIEILRSDWNSYSYQFSAPSYPIQHYPVEYTNQTDPCSIM